MKVFILLSRLERGGAELRTLSLLKEISKLPKSKLKKYEFIVFLTSGDKGELDKEFEKFARLIYRDKQKSITKSFVSSVSRNKPDVIHINANLASGVYCFLGWLLRVPSRISHIRTTSDYGAGLLYNIKKKIFIRLINMFSTQIIGVCNAAKNFVSARREKWITVYNGITPPNFSSKQVLLADRNKPIKTLMVGRLSDIKNHAFAINMISETPFRILLDIYGEGEESYTSYLENLISNKGQINISLKGNALEPMSVMKDYDLLLLPSKREGLPGVALESLFVGTPVISSELDGCLEIMQHSSYICCLPTESEDYQRWINKIEEFGSKRVQRDLVISEMHNSPFDMDSHTSSILSCWNVRNEK